MIVFGDVRRDGRLGQRGVPGPAPRRGHLRPVHELRLRGQHRGGRGSPAPAGRRDDDQPAAQVVDTPDTPTIETLVDLAQRARLPRSDRRLDRGRHAEERRRQLAHPDGTRELLASACPGDREVDLKRLGAQLEPAEVEPFDDGRLRAAPGAGQGLHRPGRAGRGEPAASATCVDPRVVEGSAWVTGANEPGRHAFDLVAGRDFTADGAIGAAEIRDGDPCPALRRPLEIARGIEMGHVFQLGRKYADALGLTALGQNGKPVDGHDGLLRRRRHPRGRRDRRGHARRARAVLAARGRAGRRAPRRHRQGRRASSRPPSSSPPSSRRTAST